MCNRVLITGSDGFTGRYLSAELSRAGYEIIGLVRTKKMSQLNGVDSVFACDLCDVNGLSHVIEQVRPDAVVHLAGIAFVAHGDAETIYRTNLVGSRNLLEALANGSKKPRVVLLASSANVYGNATIGVLDETAPPAPANDYAVSKLAMEYVAKLYADRLPIIIARPFNYAGVGQAESFLIPKIVAHVRRHAPVIELGNLDVARDFSDVRTVVQYYRRLLETPAAIGDTFNICSGKAYTLQDVLALVCRVSGHDFDVKVNPAFVRANEVKMLIGSRAKLDSVVGEMPELTLEETIRWMIGADLR